MDLPFFKKKKNHKASWKAELAAFLCLLAALWLFCVLSMKVLMPKRHDLGATWDMYALEEPNTIDILFFGSSLVYCDVVPAMIYEESQIPGYVMAGPAQTFPITYRYLRECCKSQSPTTVFIECTGLIYEQSDDLKPNLAYMPYDWERLAPTLEFTKGDMRKGLLFPLYSYHDRWDKLEPEDWQPYEPDPLAGYTFISDVYHARNFARREVPESTLEDPERYLLAQEYVSKILDYCRQRQIRVVFYVAPALLRLEESFLRRAEEDITAKGGEFVNFYEAYEEIGLDMSTDFRDSLHLNALGAEKFSRYLGKHMAEWAQPRAKADPALWRQRAAYFTEKREEVEVEIFRSLEEYNKEKGGEAA